MKKLFHSSGETLVETLVSILIIALASLLFLSMVTAAVHITRSAAAQSDKLETAWDDAETRSGTASGTVTVKSIVAGTVQPDVTIPVTATTKDSGLVAYWN